MSLSGSECLPNDLVFTARGTIGQVGLISSQARYSRYIASANQLRLRANIRKALPMYLYYWFSSVRMRRFMQSSSTSTGVPNMNLGTLKSLPLPLPPLAEQQAIAAVLDGVDDAVKRGRAERKGATIAEGVRRGRRLLTGHVRMGGEN